MPLKARIDWEETNVSDGRRWQQQLLLLLLLPLIWAPVLKTVTFSKALKTPGVSWCVIRSGIGNGGDNQLWLERGQKDRQRLPERIDKIETIPPS